MATSKIMQVIRTAEGLSGACQRCEKACMIVFFFSVDPLVRADGDHRPPSTGRRSGNPACRATVLVVPLVVGLFIRAQNAFVEGVTLTAVKE